MRAPMTDDTPGWQYRVMRNTETGRLSIHEFYNLGDGNTAYTEELCYMGAESIQGLRSMLKGMRAALRMPILEFQPSPAQEE